MNRRFGIKADVAGPDEVLQRLQEYRQGDTIEFALICSMQGMRPGRLWEEDDAKHGASSVLARYLKENEFQDSLIDLVVIDEAHYLRNPESMTSKLGRLLRPVTEHLVLLSATPIHLRSEDLFHLLNLVDEDTFEQKHVFDEILAANEPLIRARDEVLRRTLTAGELMVYLKEAKAKPFLKNNRQLANLAKYLPSDLDLQETKVRSKVAHQLESINLLSNAVTRTRKRDVTNWKVLREAVSENISLSPVEQSLYTNLTALVRDYCARNDVSEGFLLSTPQRQLSSSMPAALGEWIRRGESLSESLYEDLGIDDQELKAGPLVQELASKASTLADLATVRANDSKYKKLREMLLHYFQHHESEKIILFAYFRPTLHYLSERLEAEGISCKLLMGGMEEDKQEIIDNFQKDKDVRVLLSSEVASEGVDLQFCRLVINYDLPWNPMKVEQRIGRLDRIGQKANKILIWNLFYKDTIDERIYNRLYMRLGIFERALGGLEAILGEQIQSLSRDLLSGQLTPIQEEERIEQTAQALSYLKEEEERLEDEAGNLIAHGDYILNQVQAAKDLSRTVTGEDLQSYICDFFSQHYTGSSFVRTKSSELEYEVRLSEVARADLGEFLKKHKLHGNTKLAMYQTSPTHCEFKNKVQGIGIGRTEIISQFHPLTRFVADKIKEKDESYHQVVAVNLRHQDCPLVEPGDYVFSVHQWSVEGIRTIERLFIAALEISNSESYLGELAAEQLVTSAARIGKDWSAAVNCVDLEHIGVLGEKCISHQISEYEVFIENLENENEDRADIQKQSLERHRERQLGFIHRRIETLIEKGRGPEVINLQKAQIKSLENKIGGKLSSIEKNRQLKHHPKEICLGLIRLE